MTKDEINRRVAELMGWIHQPAQDGYPEAWLHPKADWQMTCEGTPPDFCGDPLLWGPAFIEDLVDASTGPDEDGEILWWVHIKEQYHARHTELIPAFWLARIAREEARRGG